MYLFIIFIEISFDYKVYKLIDYILKILKINNINFLKLKTKKLYF